nr:hypothetical protein [Tanacetum cinerariifolium]
EDINQIDEDDMEEMDIKWNMALLSMRADKFWKRTGKKIIVDGKDPTEFALMANIENKVFNNSLCSNDCKKNTDSLNSKIKELKSELSKSDNYLYHYKLGVAQFEKRLKEYKEREETYIVKIRTLEMYRASDLDSIKILTNEVETLKEEKDVVDGKLARLLISSKDLENIIETPTNTDPTGRTTTLTIDDMQKKKNDVKARTTLLLSLPDEHQLRFSKYKTAKEL